MEKSLNNWGNLFGIQKDPKISGAVLTGFGTRAFVSGADIGMLASQNTPEEAEGTCLKTQAVLNLIESLGKPVVCAMNGLAFGGGNEIAMACSARITKKGQKVFVAQPEPRAWLHPRKWRDPEASEARRNRKGLAHAPKLQPHLLGPAKEIGLIQEEVEDDLIESAMDWVKKIRSRESLGPLHLQKAPSPSLRNFRRSISDTSAERSTLCSSRSILEGARMTLDEGLKLEAKIFGECLLTKDMKYRSGKLSEKWSQGERKLCAQLIRSLFTLSLDGRGIG